MDNKAIETLAIDTVRNLAVRSNYLDQYIPDNDKEPFFDGFIYLYCQGGKCKENYRGRVANIDAILSMKESTKGFDEMGTLFEQIIYRRNQYLAASRNSNMTGRIDDTSEMPFNREHLEYLSMISYLYGIFPEAYKCLALADHNKLYIEGECEISYTELVNKCQYQWLKKRLALHKRF